MNAPRQASTVREWVYHELRPTGIAGIDHRTEASGPTGRLDRSRRRAMRAGRSLALGLALSIPATVLSAGCQAQDGSLARRVAAAEPPDAGLPGRPDESGSITLRRLWAGENFSFYQSAPSPDGRYVTEIDWSTGDLALRDLETGSLVHITDKGSWEVSGDYPESARFSPDGRRVAYTWYNEARDAMEIRVMGVRVDTGGTARGSEPRVILPGDPLVPYWLFGWTRDDRLLIGLEQPDRTWAIGFVTMSTGSLRVLKSFDWRPPGAALSPDGTQIAFDHPSTSGSSDRDIYLLAADGSRERTLVDGDGNDVVLGWVPSDGSLLFYSDRSGIPSIWRLPMAGDRASGDPAPISEDVRKLAPLGFAGDVYYFGVTVEKPAFRTASLDSERRLLVDPGVTFESFDERSIQNLAWSPEGEYVAHDANGPLGSSVVVRNSDGVIVRQWSLNGGLSRWLRWAPDGESVFVAAVDRRGRKEVSRIDLKSGERETTIRLQPVESDLSFSVSADGRVIYHARAAAGPQGDRVVDLVALDLASRTERVVRRVLKDGPVEVSPDGVWLAHTGGWPDSDRAVSLYPVDGGNPRVLPAVERGSIRAIAGWTPDSQYVLYVVQLPSAGDAPSTFELWRGHRDGDGAERIAVLPEAVGPAIQDPTGHTIAFLAGRLRGEIWALDGISQVSSTENRK